jgi:hypothetical protein
MVEQQQACDHHVTPTLLHDSSSCYRPAVHLTDQPLAELSYECSWLLQVLHKLTGSSGLKNVGHSDAMSTSTSSTSHSSRRPVPSAL